MSSWPEPVCPPGMFYSFLRHLFFYFRAFPQASLSYQFVLGFQDVRIIRTPESFFFS